MGVGGRSRKRAREADDNRQGDGERLRAFVYAAVALHAPIIGDHESNANPAGWIEATKTVGRDRWQAPNQKKLQSRAEEAWKVRQPNAAQGLRIEVSRLSQRLRWLDDFRGT